MTCLYICICLFDYRSLPDVSTKSLTRNFRNTSAYVCPYLHCLLYCVARKYGIEVRDFGRSFRDGHAFNAMIHNVRDDLVQMDELPRRSNKQNLRHAFNTAETHLGIPALLDPEGDAYSDDPDSEGKCKSTTILLCYSIKKSGVCLRASVLCLIIRRVSLSLLACVVRRGRG